MLAEKKAIVEEIKIQKIKDVAIILVNKGEIHKLAHIVMLQNIVRWPIRKNIPKSCQMLKKKLNCKKRPILAILPEMAKGIIFFQFYIIINLQSL